jgi:hypothetical protein
MEEERFDRLSRALGAEASRRGALGLLAGLGSLGLSGAKATHGHGKGRQRRPAKRKGKTKRQHGAQAHGRRSRERRGRQRVGAESVCYPNPRCSGRFGAFLAKCDFGGSSTFQHGACVGCTLNQANLRGAQAAGVTFTAVNLSGACLVDADFSGGTFLGVNTLGAIFCRTRMPNGSLNNSGCSKGTSCCPTCDGQHGCGGETICCQGVCRERVWSHLTNFGSVGGGADQFTLPNGVAVTPDGQTVWVADALNQRISVWGKSGGTWDHLTNFGSNGGGADQLRFPRGVAVAADGQTAWVADTNNQRISVWTKAGSSWSHLTNFGSTGSGADQLDFPFGVAATPDGQTVWVADSNNNRISVWGLGCPAG